MTYEYKCKQCELIHELQFPMGEAQATAPCPECGTEMNRTFSNAGFVLKGPGDHYPSQQLKRKRQQTKNNEAAGKNMKRDWDGFIPKLKYE